MSPKTRAILHKLYLTVRGLTVAWAVGIVVYALYQFSDEGIATVMDLLGAFTIAVVPFVVTISLHRWFLWLTSEPAPVVQTDLE